MGSGIATMHYVGMEAMRMAALHTYSPALVALSVVLAIVISFVALWLTFHLRSDATAWSKKKMVAALVMGAAIPVMHYTGMAAVTFTPSTMHFHDVSNAVSVSALGTVGIVLVTLDGAWAGSADQPEDRHAVAHPPADGASFPVPGRARPAGHSGRGAGRAGRSPVASVCALLIGAAGQQSMLSQTLTKDVLLLAATPEGAARQQIAARIQEAARRWQRSHESLQTKRSRYSARRARTATK